MDSLLLFYIFLYTTYFIVIMMCRRVCQKSQVVRHLKHNSPPTATQAIISVSSVV